MVMAPPQSTSTIYVDEAGSPHFQRLRDGNRKRGYVVCAACIPDHARDAILAILPRDANGFVKASSRMMSPDDAESFIAHSLDLDLDIGLVLLDTGSDGNVSKARRFTEKSNARRKARGNPSIVTAHLVYAIAAKEAIIGAWSHASIRRSAELATFHVVMDNASITNHTRLLFERASQEAFERIGIACRSVTWASEENEPLLYVPDIFAGVYRRQVTHGDVRGAWAQIEGAAASGRIHLQDGMETSAPGVL
jgi:hypothetical protein